MNVHWYQDAARRVGDERASAVGVAGEPCLVEGGLVSGAAREPRGCEGGDETLQEKTLGRFGYNVSSVTPSARSFSIMASASGVIRSTPDRL